MLVYLCHMLTKYPVTCCLKDYCNQAQTENDAITVAISFLVVLQMHPSITIGYLLSGGLSVELVSRLCSLHLLYC